MNDDIAKGEPPKQALAVEFVNEQLVGVCQHGHESVLMVQEFDFQILFDMGGMALLDGYTREAVTSMAAALERGYEFYIHLITQAREVSPVVIEAVRKIVASRSEREIGAFAAAFALCEDEAPPVLADTFVKFRNDCVHKGAIPPKQEAILFGAASLSILARLAAMARTKYKDGFHKVMIAHLQKRHGGATVVASMSIPTMVSFNRPRDGSETFEALLDDLSRYRNHVWIT